MFCRIHVIVLSITDRIPEYFTNIRKLDLPSSTFRAIRQFLNNPTQIDEGYMRDLAIHVLSKHKNVPTRVI
jgi:hypothetical protein